MKKTLLSLFILLLIVTTTFSQTTIDLDVKSVPKTEQQLIEKAVKTDNTAKYKGENHPIYKSATGKFFIVVLAKSGNYYRKYIKAELLAGS